MASNDTPTSAKERIHSPASSLKHELHVGKGIASRIASKDAMRDLHNMKASLRLLLLVLLVSALMGIAAWAFLAPSILLPNSAKRTSGSSRCCPS